MPPLCIFCGQPILSSIHHGLQGTFCTKCYQLLNTPKKGGKQYVAYKRSTQNPYQAYNPLGGTSSYNAQTKSQPQCSFEWDVARCAYSVKTQYQENFIEFIKAKIPGSDRAWDPTTKTWFIKEAW